MQCRLLQPPTTGCAECGASDCVAPVELVRELLHYRDLRFGKHRDWGMITAFIAGGSLAFPILAPFAITSVVAFGVYSVHQRVAARRQIVGVPLVAAVARRGATSVYGVPRRFRATLTSLFDEAPVLVEHAVIKDRKGAVLVRRSEATPFVIDDEDADAVLVAGVTRIASPHMLVRRMKIERGDPRLARMGVPPDLAIRGELEVASVVADGTRLAVTGFPEDEVLPELAFHRDGGRMRVMRGRVGAPVIIEDPRLRAVGTI